MIWRHGKRRAVRAAAVIRNVAAEGEKSRLPQMAAALSYRTIFGLLPTTVVALLVLRALANDQDIEQLVDQSLKYAGLSNITLGTDATGAIVKQDVWSVMEQAAPPATGYTFGDPTAVYTYEDWLAANEPEHVRPGVSSLSATIKTLIKRAGSIDFRAISIVGVLVLIYAAISMLVEIERAFNQVYRVPVGRSWVRRITNYWTLLTLGTLGLFATFYFGARFQHAVLNMANAEGLMSSNALWVAATGFIITVGISTALFLIMYELVPNTRVRVWCALVGAFVAALLWEAGKWAFTRYVVGTAGYTKLYGSIALIPLFLLWIYYTWMIVLFGLYVSHFLQHTRMHTHPQPRLEIEPAIVDPAAALLVMDAVARSFRSGKPGKVAPLAKSTHLSEGMVERILNRLAERGLVHRIGDAGQPEEVAYALARPPEDIAAAEVLAVGYELSTTGRDEQGQPSADQSGVLARLRAAQLAAAGQANLLSLMGSPPTPRPLPVPAGPRVQKVPGGAHPSPAGDGRVSMPSGSSPSAETAGPSDADPYPNGLDPDRLEPKKEGARQGE